MVINIKLTFLWGGWGVEVNLKHLPREGYIISETVYYTLLTRVSHLIMGK